MGKKDLRVALYCRVASEDQMGINAQRQQLSRYALSNGYHQISHYEDNGASGLTFDRPGFNQMQADIEAGKIDLVLVKDVSRIGRDCLRTSQWIDRLLTSGKAFETADGVPYESLPPEALNNALKDYRRKALAARRRQHVHKSGHKKME